MIGSALVPMAASQPRSSGRPFLLVAVVLSAKARFKSNRRSRKALLIGISYQGSDSKEHRLRGPHKDVRMLQRALIEKFGFRQSEIVLLLDRKRGDAYNPTRENVMRELNKFVSSKDKNTDYVFAYAGHCMQFKVPQTQEEPDGLAESLVPVDALTATGDPVKDMVIFDFDLKKLLVESLGPNSRLVAIVDACSSATVLNLEHHRCNRTGSITAKGKYTFKEYWPPIYIRVFGYFHDPKALPI
ncbi:hypothetical protein D9619_009286 [Psilocybe cf. subviscida]|uniref:Peptidase C14 caspase domain-containing protein n=1 Tax=Psilocybe cf. subviscida TaxID=2480587 RepID=A0A8H5BV27_9AGAR|nr:hypothetical protein D9619_009286 [Psilocybe cf. subviscida]